MAKNVHKVNKRQWKKFGKMGQAMFNRLWYQITPHTMRNLLGCKSLNQKECNILRWNICFLAACEAKQLEQDRKLGWFK